MKEPFSLKGYVVWGVCALFFLYEFALRTMLGTFQHPMMTDLHLTALQFSVLSTTVFFLIYGLMQVPAGIVLDYFGLKKTLALAALACSFSTTLMAYTHTYPVAILARVMMGFGASFGFVGLMVAVHDWMPRCRIGLYVGLSQFIGTLGPMLAAGPLDSLSREAHVDWRRVFIALTVIGAVLVVTILCVVENNTQKAGRYIVLKRPEPVGRLLSQLFSRVQPWYLAVTSACLYVALEYLSDTEGRIFLEMERVGPNAASYMITLAWLGYAMGCPLVGWFSDYVERRQQVIKWMACLSVISIMMVVYTRDSMLIGLAFLLLGVSASGQSVGFAAVPEFFKPRFVAVGFGLNNAMITIFSAVNAPLIGLLLRDDSGGVHTVMDYHHAFWVLIALSCLAVAISWCLIRETYCKSVVGLTVLNVGVK